MVLLLLVSVRPQKLSWKIKKERVNDAVAATKAALEEGIVPGGSVALLDVARRMSTAELEKQKAARDEVFGYEIVKNDTWSAILFN